MVADTVIVDGTLQLPGKDVLIAAKAVYCLGNVCRFNTSVTPAASSVGAAGTNGAAGSTGLAGLAGGTGGNGGWAGREG